MTPTDIAPLVPAGASPTGSPQRLWRQLHRNPKTLVGMIILVPIVLVAIFAPWLTPYPYDAIYVGDVLGAPTSEHWLGTDLNGRDLLSRLIIGTRVVVGVPLAVGLLTLVIGVPIGLLAGYLRGVVDGVLMRVVDVFLSFPWLLVALGLAAVLGAGLSTVIVTLVVVYWPQVARVTRNSVMAVSESEYVTAAAAIGEPRSSIVLRYVLRNAYFPILVLLSSMLAFSILNEAGISFLGFGIQSPQTSWGLELAAGSTYLTAAPHLVIFPGLAIVLVVLGMNMFADGLGDLLNRQGRER
ncbi:ABC transporter permease [Pseudactinotalea suaedae]|uniref:ABC transporter permease n=1 Tax=Pseudactinotalea suaedae TaxID=1524924 RepID=UPI0012E23478|nr:ABC transporter permease [Pseudactinotalea suaedae]